MDSQRKRVRRPLLTGLATGLAQPGMRKLQGGGASLPLQCAQQFRSLHDSSLRVLTQRNTASLTAACAQAMLCCAFPGGAHSIALQHSIVPHGIHFWIVSIAVMTLSGGSARIWR
eukprot:TRINITY_DN7492_c0_g1_i1.p2 TRINITY_DN7492_c0_g1~~TRINITY_DN7492_c0_g1_i1.p2  ORF type:complete len:115 (-),score=8.63 TRINITY_DN7492_c0_g1_i1:243-587(-)